MSFVACKNNEKKKRKKKSKKEAPSPINEVLIVCKSRAVFVVRRFISRYQAQ